MQNNEYDQVGPAAPNFGNWRKAERRHGVRQAFVLVAAFTALSATRALPQSNPVQLAPDGDFIFSLTENPTTGYVWRFDPKGSTNTGVVNVTDLGFARPQPAQPMVGAPGVHRWSIKGIRMGRASLHFINSRPWEGTPVEQRTIAVVVR
jgi:inhibitor of cysteine peptidase